MPALPKLNKNVQQESDINTPAIGAAFVIKKHNKSDVETEISLEIGELVSVVRNVRLVFFCSTFFCCCVDVGCNRFHHVNDPR